MVLWLKAIWCRGITLNTFEIDFDKVCLQNENKLFNAVTVKTKAGNTRRIFCFQVDIHVCLFRWFLVFGWLAGWRARLYTTLYYSQQTTLRAWDIFSYNDKKNTFGNQILVKCLGNIIWEAGFLKWFLAIHWCWDARNVFRYKKKKHCEKMVLCQNKDSRMIRRSSTAQRFSPSRAEWKILKKTMATA